MPASVTRLTLVIALAIAAQLSSARAGDAGVEFFETNVRPILVEHCYECHSVRSKEPGGGLLLDSRQGWQKGGESGAVILPGKPDDSRLVMAVRYTNDALQMPPTGKLPAAAIAGLEAWVSKGAPDPRDQAGPKETAGAWMKYSQVAASGGVCSRSASRACRR
jgi:mono/diheme cytochrome c family protein